MESKKELKVCVDFDGVIAKYDGYKGGEHYGEPIEGAKEFLEKLKSCGLKPVIFSARNPENVITWFKKYSFPTNLEVTNVKIPAPVYIDDRGLKFNGDFSKLLKDLKNFNCYWSKNKIFKSYIR